jgi:TonB family protein
MQRTMPGPDLLDRPSRGIWLFAALVAVALHLGGGLLGFSHLTDSDAEDDAGTPGLVIGLELAAPRGEPTDLPVGPDSAASAPSTAQAEQKVVQKQSDLPKDTPQDVAEPDRLVAPVAPKEPEQRTLDKPLVQTTPSVEAAASEAAAMPTSETAPESDKSVTLAEGVREAVQRDRVEWGGRVHAHLRRYLRYPADRQQQVAEVQVSLTIDRTGHLLSSSIAKSSGDPSFDAAALSMLKRADPLPPPPARVADEGLTFTLPVGFHKGRN